MKETMTARQFVFLVMTKVFLSLMVKVGLGVVIGLVFRWLWNIDPLWFFIALGICLTQADVLLRKLEIGKRRNSP